MTFFAFLKTVVDAFFSKPATYPVGGESKSAITRGHIENVVEQCIFCGMCTRKCPTDAIIVERANKEWVIDRFRCIQCNACVECCPKKCLVMKQELSRAAFERYSDTEKGAVGGA